MVLRESARLRHSARRALTSTSPSRPCDQVPAGHTAPVLESRAPIELRALDTAPRLCRLSSFMLRRNWSSACVGGPDTARFSPESLRWIPCQSRAPFRRSTTHDAAK
jgi:hypothetical protein